MLLTLVVRAIHRGWMGMVALAGLVACRQPNPDWLGPSDSAAATSEDDGVATLDGDASTADDGTASTDGPVPAQCDPEPVPGAGECPTECTACDGGRCLVDCAVLDCENTTVECPAGWPCDFVCSGDSVCKRGKLHCAADRDCTVDCQGVEACQAARVTCGAATCAVTCGAQNDACRSLDLDCGPADATITCESPEGVAVHPIADSPCACESIGCDG